MSEWQLIETAPKYDYFLGWSEIEDFQVLIFDQSYFRNDDYVIYHPTHWMILPEAPQ